MRVFQVLGCIGCHRYDATGIGSVLSGRAQTVEAAVRLRGIVSHNMGAW
jgi:hypothetical protein